MQVTQENKEIPGPKGKTIVGSLLAEPHFTLRPEREIMLIFKKQ